MFIELWNSYMVTFHSICFRNRIWWVLHDKIKAFFIDTYTHIARLHFSFSLFLVWARACVRGHVYCDFVILLAAIISSFATYTPTRPKIKRKWWHTHRLQRLLDDINGILHVTHQFWLANKYEIETSSGQTY